MGFTRSLHYFRHLTTFIFLFCMRGGEGKEFPLNSMRAYVYLWRFIGVVGLWTGYLTVCEAMDCLRKCRRGPAVALTHRPRLRASRRASSRKRRDACATTPSATATPTTKVVAIQNINTNPLLSLWDRRGKDSGKRTDVNHRRPTYVSGGGKSGTEWKKRTQRIKDLM